MAPRIAWLGMVGWLLFLAVGPACSGAGSEPVDVGEVRTASLTDLWLPPGEMVGDDRLTDYSPGDPADRGAPAAEVAAELVAADQTGTESGRPAETQGEAGLEEMVDSSLVDDGPESWAEAGPVETSPADSGADGATDGAGADDLPQLPGCGLGMFGKPCDDGDPCTVGDKCLYSGICSGSPLDCDDSNPCTLGDFCAGGQCFAGVKVCQCATDSDCTVVDNGNWCDGIFRCSTLSFPFTCQFDPQSVVDCSQLQGGPCQSVSCNPANGECEFQPLADGLPCDDGELCTVGDGCLAGECAGLALPACNIGAPCGPTAPCLTGQQCLTGLPGNYCTKLACWDDSWCPAGAVCRKPEVGLPPLCLAACGKDGDCRVAEGYTCQDGGCWCGGQLCTPGQLYCDGESVCQCNPCGSGCAVVVEQCTPPQSHCLAGSCTFCLPDCQGRECGDDGCGGSCGQCPGTSQCNGQTGICECLCSPEQEPMCEPATGITWSGPCKAACNGAGELQPGPCGGLCQTSCSAGEVASGPWCGVDGLTYPSFCALKCAIGLNLCTLAECGQAAYAGACGLQCVVEPAGPAKVGGPAPQFFCVDRNANSPTFGSPYNPVTMAELVWIAYFGACT